MKDALYCDSAFFAKLWTGVVLDATGEPMIGASVVVKGKSGLGTVTDIDGNFTLRNVKKGDVIRITSLGMTPVEM